MEGKERGRRSRHPAEQGVGAIYPSTPKSQPQQKVDAQQTEPPQVPLSLLKVSEVPTKYTVCASSKHLLTSRRLWGLRKLPCPSWPCPSPHLCELPLCWMPTHGAGLSSYKRCMVICDDVPLSGASPEGSQVALRAARVPSALLLGLNVLLLYRFCCQ